MTRRPHPSPLALAALLALVALLAVPAAVAAPPPQGRDAAAPSADPAMTSGRELTTAFYRGELADVHQRFSAEMKQQIPLEDLQGFLKQVGEQMGVEQEVLDERVEDRGEYRVYARRARFEKFPEEVVVLWAFRPDGEVGGFFIRPAEPPAPSPTPAPAEPDPSGG